MLKGGPPPADYPGMGRTATPRTVAPQGPLDVDTAELVEADVHALRRAGAREVVVDLHGVTFVDSYGLRVLLALRNAAARDGFRLTLVPGPASVQRLFDLTATRTLFDWAA